MKMLIVFLMSLLSVHAKADWNPSDDVSPEIQVLATDAIKTLVGKADDLDPYIDAIIKQMPKVRAYMTDEKLTADSNGETQDSIAMNFPTLGLIVINRARWAKLTSLPFRRALALHEVSSLMYLESTGVYNFSSAFITLAGLSPVDFKRAISSESSTPTGDGFSGAGCPWTADRLSFFFEIWTTAVETCQNRSGLHPDFIAGFKERRLREMMQLAQRNCSTEAKVLSDVANMNALIDVYKKSRPAACSQ